MNTPRWFRLVVCLLPTLVMAVPPAPTPTPAPPTRQVPAVLRDWESWATWDAVDRFSPPLYNDAKKRQSLWPSRLAMQVDGAGGKFDFGVSVYAQTWVQLPGGDEAWPVDVKVDGALFPVVERGGRPAMLLGPGNHRIEGGFRWSEIPPGLPLPTQIGILALTLEGKPVEAPTWDAEGFLWLKRDASTEEVDRDFLAVKVYALIEDGIPMWLHTQVELIVSGKSREEDLGNILPEGWKLSAVNSPLPVVVDDAGRMKVQVRAGKWTVNLDAFRLDNGTELRYAPEAKPAVADELVAFRAKPDFRMVDISGAPAIDVSQTTLPAEWREFPVYRWDTAAPLRIEERMRGMGEQAPERLKISRMLWLDENGAGLTFRDRISGRMQQIWRLDAAAGQDLGSVRMDGEGQLITRNAQNNAPGVEIRTRQIDLEATGRMARTGSLSATGWRSDADSLNVALNLPPGWRLFALFGADWVKGDWLTAWTLLDLFLLLIFSLAVFRLWGFGPAVIAFLAFGISYHEPGAPRYVWLVLLIPLALLRVVVTGWGRRILQIWKWVMVMSLVLILAPFLGSQVQQALFPQLENLRPYQAQTIADFDASERASVSSTSSVNEGAPNAPVPEAKMALFSPPSETYSSNIVTKQYKVPPGFLPPTKGSDSRLSSFSSSESRSSAKDYLESVGVEFPPGSSATYIPGSSVLIVRNTAANLDLIDSLTDAAMAAPSGPDNNMGYDTKARIQTGPGVPDWTWRQVTFGWNGPVQASQQIRPILISLALERVLTVLRIVLLLVLGAILLNAGRLRASLFQGARRAAVWTALFLIVGGGANAQDIPDKEMLETLRTRLLQPSEAFPNAASIPSVALTIKDRRISMDAEIHAAVRTAVPLPGKLPEWSPVSVTVDGKPEAALRREDGFLWVVLPEGVHRVQVEGLLSGATEWEWTYQLKPRRVTIDAPGWNVSGVRSDGMPEQQVFFVLKQKTAGLATYDRQDYQALVQVERHLELGLIWQVRTTVTRLTPGGKAISVRVPLLTGENVLSANVIIKDGLAEVRLGAREESFTWSSELSISEHLKLATKSDDTWVERWNLVASPVWNVSMSGLSPVFEPGDVNLVPVWRPWPGESVDLTISRPEAIPGATVTVNKGTQTINIGKRQRTTHLELSVRCSLGEDFLIGLPPGAEVTTLSYNGSNLPVRKDGDRVIIPLLPGDQSLALEWKTNTPLTALSRVEEVRLPVDSANINTIVNMPENRWILWADGPLRGPAVRFWTVLVCSLIAAGVLGRIRVSPLHPIEWMLLTIGLTQVPLGVALVVVAWLFFLAWRGHESFLRLPVLGFNLLQVLLILVTALSLGIFVGVVAQGLLGDPKMFIAGNGSYATTLRWYQPQCENVLSRPGCVSISIWWFRIIMLIWALWLAASLIRWLRWAWIQFSTGGCFRRNPPKLPTTPPPLK